VQIPGVLLLWLGETDHLLYEPMASQPCPLWWLECFYWLLFANTVLPFALSFRNGTRRPASQTSRAIRIPGHTRGPATGLKGLFLKSKAPAWCGSIRARNLVHGVRSRQTERRTGGMTHPLGGTRRPTGETLRSQTQTASPSTRRQTGAYRRKARRITGWTQWFPGELLRSPAPIIWLYGQACGSGCLETAQKCETRPGVLFRVVAIRHGPETGLRRAEAVLGTALSLTPLAIPQFLSNVPNGVLGVS